MLQAAVNEAARRDSGGLLYFKTWDYQFRIFLKS